jgi:hypothetical protein
MVPYAHEPGRAGRDGFDLREVVIPQPRVAPRVADVPNVGNESRPVSELAQVSVQPLHGVDALTLRPAEGFVGHVCAHIAKQKGVRLGTRDGRRHEAVNGTPSGFRTSNLSLHTS